MLAVSSTRYRCSLHGGGSADPLAMDDFSFRSRWRRTRASQVELVIKNPRVNAGDVKDAGSIPKSGRFPGEGHSNPL